MSICHVTTRLHHLFQARRPHSPRWLAFILTACLACSPAQADNNPPPGATLEAKFTCSLQPVWNDKRSRADLDGFFYLPYVGPTEYLIGGYGNRNKTLLPSDCVLTLRDPAYLTAPAGWELVWKDKGSGAKLDGSMWRAIPPSEDYRCVGHVPQEGYDEPYIPNYRCVHAAFTEEIVTGEMIWSDKGSGADKPVTMLHLPNTRSFVAVGARVGQLEAYDLRVDHANATGDVVVVQAGGSDSPASEAASAELADEESSGAALIESTDEEAGSAATTEAADLEAEASQSLNTGSDSAKAQPDAAGDEATRLRAAAEAALAAENFDLAADYLARLRALRPDSPKVAEGQQKPSTAQSAQADGNASEPAEQAAAQADTGVAQPVRERPVETDPSVSEAADKPKPFAAIDPGVLEAGNEPPITLVAADSGAGDETSGATETGLSEVNEDASVTADADAPEASDTAPAQTGADTGDMPADDEPPAQADTIETTPEPSDVTGTTPSQQPEPQATGTKRQTLPPDAGGRVNSLAKQPGETDAIGSLLERGADPNWQGFMLRTSLHEAAIACQPLNLELLLRYGGDPGRQDLDGNTPLHFATGGVFPAMGDINNCTIDSVRALLEGGADPNQVNAEGNAPLHAVVSDGPIGSDVEAANINALLEAGADPNLANVEGNGPLHFAFIHTRASLNVAGALLDGGAQPDAANAEGMTPLMLAARHGGSAGSYGDETVALLLDVGADPNRTNPDGDAPLHILVKKKPDGDSLPAAAIAEALLAGGADPCMRDADGSVPYEYVSSDSPVANALAEAGGSLSPVVQVDAEGNTFQACRADEERMAEEDDFGSSEEDADTAELEQQPQEANQYAGEMVAIPGGTFQMGDLSGEGHDRERPVHSVTVPAFQLGKYEVTVGQFRSFVEATGYRTDAERNAAGEEGCYIFTGDNVGWTPGRSWRSPGYSVEDDQPVVCVSWNDAQAFIEWLTMQTGESYRLPTEAEWEYAARAGSTTKYHFGNDESQLCGYANHADRNTSLRWRNESCSDGVGERTAEVGRYQPNSYGLYDMHGNVWEWVEDCWNESYASAPSNGSVWESGDCGQRALRGGSWYFPAGFLRSATRNWIPRSSRDGASGFRLAQDQTYEEQVAEADSGSSEEDADTAELEQQPQDDEDWREVPCPDCVGG